MSAENHSIPEHIGYVGSGERAADQKSLSIAELRRSLAEIMADNQDDPRIERIKKSIEALESEEYLNE